MSPVSGELADHIRGKLNDGSFKLPSLPDPVLRVRKLMADDNYSVSDISNILSRDTAFATVVMRLANSAHFNSSGHEIRNMTMAIQRVGTDSILKLLISVASRMFCKVKQPELRKTMTTNQDHCLLVAAAAQQVAHVSQAADPADTFMAGLLHDQGKEVLLMAIPDELLQASSAERDELMVMFHREMGARLLHKWGLPEEFALVAQHHGIESPDRPRFSMLDCIDVAEAIGYAIQDEREGMAADFASLPPVQRLRLSETQITGIIMDIEDQIEELRQAFTV